LIKNGGQWETISATIYLRLVKNIEVAFVHHSNQRQKLLISLATILTGAIFLGGVGIYLVLKAVESPGKSEISTSETSIPAVDVAPVETSVISPSQGDTSITSRVDSTPTQSLQKNFGGVNWQGRDLQTMDLRKAQLGGANLSRGNLKGVDLSGANLGGANLSQANLMNANLSGADLRGANLGGANLKGANLSGALLDGANTAGALMGGK
jgi:uncharacterized protein YjbI with pentapeptide repeats